MYRTAYGGFALLLSNVTIAALDRTAGESSGQGRRARSEVRVTLLRCCISLHRLAEFWAVSIFGCATGRCASGQNSALFVVLPKLLSRPYVSQARRVGNKMC